MGKSFSEMTLEELWVLFPIILTEHREVWKRWYKEQEQLLLTGLAGLPIVRISHIGSTAIPGIWAKPIIDILVGVNSFKEDASLLEKQLRPCGFYRLAVDRPDEIVFAKFTDNTFEVKTHFIHLTGLNGDLWNNLLFFRDYLNEHPDARNKYEEIKLNYVKEKNEGIVDYTDSKESFLKDIISKRQII